ncbi:MAG: fructosamine kinase family protein [Ignavibacteriales bacterium]|nr:fructosamine kinase family protein [Ignavibacteriales bacterium]
MTSAIIQMFSGEKYFLKINNHVPSDMFTKEANGLKEIEKSKSIRVPKVEMAKENFILMECIEGKNKSKNFFEDFGIQFAKMHKYEGECFGFYEDNYIGSTIQKNIPSEEEKLDWTKFYFNKRLLFQFKLAEINGYVDSELRKYFSLLENKIEQILDSKPEKPSLLHGDLWAGNYIADENGRACLIDPAVYYGNREADLAMTKLFGGFTKDFYTSYDKIYPLKDGHDYRENIYKLYHVLNHLNLFGSGYYQQALSLIKFYL